MTSLPQDGVSMEISRKNGIPVYLRYPGLPVPGPHASSGYRVRTRLLLSSRSFLLTTGLLVPPASTWCYLPLLILLLLATIYYFYSLPLLPRLAEKWAFSLCTELRFPILEQLLAGKVHGPVPRCSAPASLAPPLQVVGRGETP